MIKQCFETNGNHWIFPGRIPLLFPFLQKVCRNSHRTGLHELLSFHNRHLFKNMAELRLATLCIQLVLAQTLSEH